MAETTGTFKYRGKVIHLGHPARIRPSSPGKHDGFEALIRRIHVNNGHLRTLHPSRVEPYLRNVEKKKASLK
jgi:hypothetical protein